MFTKFQKEQLYNQHLTVNYLSGIPAEKQEWHPKGKWSAKDQLAHLVKYQLEFLRRMKLIASSESPSFERYNADVDPEFALWRKLSLAELVGRLISGRGEIITYLQSLQEEQLHRTGTHPVYGKLSIIEWTEFFLLHEAHHLFSIYQLTHRTVFN